MQIDPSAQALHQFHQLFSFRRPVDPSAPRHILRKKCRTSRTLGGGCCLGSPLQQKQTNQKAYFVKQASNKNQTSLSEHAITNYILSTKTRCFFSSPQSYQFCFKPTKNSNKTPNNARKHLNKTPKTTHYNSLKTH